MANSHLILWHVQHTVSFFLIPSDLTLPAGNEVLEDFDGHTVSVELTALQHYGITFTRAQEFLETKWKEAVEQSKKAWNNLNSLSLITGKGYNMDELKDSLTGIFSHEDPAVKQAFDQGKLAVESLVQSVQNGDPKSKEEQKAVLKRIFDLMPGLGNAFDDQTLEEAVKDPDAWAKKLEEQFLKPQEDQQGKEQSQNRLAKDIQESIASALRKAGITPSADFDKNNSNTDPK